MYEVHSKPFPGRFPGTCGPSLHPRLYPHPLQHFPTSLRHFQTSVKKKTKLFPWEGERLEGISFSKGIATIVAALAAKPQRQYFCSHSLLSIVSTTWGHERQDVKSDLPAAALFPSTNSSKR